MLQKPWNWKVIVQPSWCDCRRLHTINVDGLSFPFSGEQGIEHDSVPVAVNSLQLTAGICPTQSVFPEGNNIAAI